MDRYKIIKLKKANNIVKRFVKHNFEKPHWVYMDFYIDDRFLNEIETDKYVNIDNWSEEELAGYAIEKIEEGSNRSAIFGF